MSDSNVETASDPVIPIGVVTAGAMLKAAREAAGLHVAALAVSMKVPVKKLEALEADRLDLLPDAVFVRALASSVCRALRIDPAPVLEKLPQTTVPRLDTEERGINAPFHTPGEQGHTSVGDVIGRPSVLLVLVLMIGALVLAFFPESRTPTDTTDVAVPVSPAAVVVPMVIPAAGVASAPLSEAEVKGVEVASPPVLVASTPALSPSPLIPASGAIAPAAAVVAVPKSASPVNAQVSAPKTVASSPITAGAANSGPDVAGLSGGLIGFSVRGPSWVEVTDAKGVVQLRKTLAAGETASASGALPLSVVVGRIDVTEVTVRGKSFSLAGLSKDNVARFEVK